MNREAEKFRRITMKVLTMQLNSILIMDLVAYGGAALGMVLAVLEFRAGRIPFWGCFAVIFLSADFFLPMRQLGSFFHIAMNGMAASDKIFTLLDLPEDAPGAVRHLAVHIVQHKAFQAYFQFLVMGRVAFCQDMETQYLRRNAGGQGLLARCAG